MLRAAWFGAALQCHSAPLVHATKSLRRSDADVHSGSNTLQLANRAVELALRSLAWLLLASAASAGRGRAIETDARRAAARKMKTDSPRTRAYPRA